MRSALFRGLPLEHGIRQHTESKDRRQMHVSNSVHVRPGAFHSQLCFNQTGRITPGKPAPVNPVPCFNRLETQFA
jgi:hypothetical protein